MIARHSRAAVLLTVAAPVLLFASTFLLWHDVRTREGFVYVRTTGIDVGTGLAAASCAVGYVALSLFLIRVFALLSVVLAFVTLGLVIAALEQFPSLSVGEVKRGWIVAVALATLWLIQSWIVLVLKPFQPVSSIRVLTGSPARAPEKRIPRTPRVDASALVQADGTLRCAACGSTQFTTKRSTRRKVVWGVWALLASANEIQCVACGRKYKRR